jgi:two-component system sensor histidine kinase KdpD
MAGGSIVERPRGPEETRSPTGIFVALAGAAAAVAVAMAIGHRLIGTLPSAYVVSVFLVAILAAAAAFGPWSGFAAALGSFFAYDFFFVEPTFTFDVADPREVFALGVFLAAAVLTGVLAGRLRETADAARQRARTLSLLHDFAERIAVTTDLDEIRALVVRRIAAAIDGPAILVDRLDEAGDAVVASPEPVTPTAEELRRIDEVYATGTATDQPSPRFVFRPLVTATGIVAVVGLGPGPGHRHGESEQAIAALIDQAATALERAHFAADRAVAQATAERERLRSALLSSISHDLRTPLATILGSVTSLRQLGDQMEPADRADLLAAIEEETDRLSRFVADLLAMTRLEAGLDVRRDWVDAADVVAAAADHLRRVHPAHTIRVRIETPPTAIRGEATLLEQVLFNLGDNAVKASKPGRPIDFRVARDGDHLIVAITDHGRGLTPEEIVRLFVRAQPRSPNPTPETHGGLGLAIARRVIGAMGGTIIAESPTPDGAGTRVTLELPIDPAGAAQPKEAGEP